MSVWERWRAGIDFPTFSPCCGIEAVHPSADVREVNRPIRDQRRRKDSGPRHRVPKFFSDRRALGGWQHRLPGRIAVNPAEGPVGRELVEGRISSGAEIDLAGNHRGRGVNDTDGLGGAVSREAPLLDELADVAAAQRLLGGTKPPTGKSVVVARPVGGRDGYSPL